MADPQVILDDAGRPAFAVIRWQDYQRLTGGRVAEDDLSDEALYDRAIAENEESFPIAVVDRIVAGENPIRVYREHRRMTQREWQRQPASVRSISRRSNGQRVPAPLQHWRRSPRPWTWNSTT